jgi:hypothetical protein
MASMEEVHEGTEEYEEPRQGLHDVSPVLGQKEVDGNKEKDHKGDPSTRTQPAHPGFGGRAGFHFLGASIESVHLRLLESRPGGHAALSRSRHPGGSAFCPGLARLVGDSRLEIDQRPERGGGAARLEHFVKAGLGDELRKPALKVVNRSPRTVEAADEDKDQARVEPIRGPEVGYVQFATRPQERADPC